MKSIRKAFDDFMEEWGYAAIGFGILIGVPAFLYYVYFSTLDTEDTFRVTRPFVSSRAVDERDADDEGSAYLELTLEGLAVPVRFHRPVFDPEDEEAPLKTESFKASAGVPVTVSIANEDEEKLEKAPAYPPSRWVEGYSIETGGKELLSLDAAIGLWAEDKKFALYLANAFVLCYLGILLFFVCQCLDYYREEKAIEEGRSVKVRFPADPAKARSASVFYYILIPGLLCGNIPAVGIKHLGGWRFDAGFWLFFAAAVAALQALFYLHHRRYLSIYDSQPREADDEPAGFFSYLALTVVFCLMLVPCLQFLYIILT